MSARRAALLRVLKFTLFSVSAGLIQGTSFFLLERLTPLPYWPCYLTALVLSVVWNFTFNRRYTFRSDASVPRAMALVALYYLVFTPLSTWGGEVLARASVNEYLVLALSMLVNFATEFLFQRFVVYRGRIDTRAPHEKE